MMNNTFYFLILLMLIVSCKGSGGFRDEPQTLDDLAVEYVRLALHIGHYDEAFVDAYYGPDSLKPGKDIHVIFSKDSLLNEVYFLLAAINDFDSGGQEDSVANRAGWLVDQLMAFARRIKIFSKDYDSFDNEAAELYGVTAPVYEEKHYMDLIAELDSILPGEGNVPFRFQALADNFIIPKGRLDVVFKAAIEECRNRTKQYFDLPEEESFSLEYVTDKSWSGYNWYKGKYKSVIQINTDIDIFIDRAIDVGSHESYPGHHVYNMLLEKNLYRDKGLSEISIYPLYSPQSLIAEGTANYGIDVVFPGNDKVVFARDVLLPLAGLDTSGISLYFKALAIKGKLNYARNEAARGIVNSTMTEEKALQWLTDYALFNAETAAKSVSFIQEHRSYVINYNYGMDLVRDYVENAIKDDPTPENRWKVFGDLMSRQVRIKELVKEAK